MQRQPSRSGSSLDGLMAQAETYANFAMKKYGSMPPTLFAVAPGGPFMFMPESLKDVAAKDDFATTARLMCIAHAATACVMALEAWVKFGKPNEKVDLTELPSKALDRKEVIVLLGESRDGQKQKLLPIIRSGNGKFFGLGEPETPGMDKMQGRFAQILPPKVPDAAMRDLAKVMLKVKGVGRAVRATTPHLPRSRH